MPELHWWGSHFLYARLIRARDIKYHISHSHHVVAFTECECSSARWKISIEKWNTTNTAFIVCRWITTKMVNQSDGGASAHARTPMLRKHKHTLSDNFHYLCESYFMARKTLTEFLWSSISNMIHHNEML